LKEGEVPLTVETALQTMKKQMGSEQAGEILRKALHQDLKNRKTAGILKDVMGDQDMLTLLATKPNQLWSKGALLNRISARDVARSVQDKSPNIQELTHQLGQYFTSSQTQ
jgi:hypothetical protein